MKKLAVSFSICSLLLAFSSLAYANSETQAPLSNTEKFSEGSMLAFWGHSGVAAKPFNADDEMGSCQQKPQCPTQKKHNSIKIRGSAFYPQGSLVRRVYDNWWPEGSLEYNYIWKHWSIFVNAAVSHKSGHAPGGAKTSITLVPVTVGCNAQIGGSSWFHPYIGIGIGGVYANIDVPHFVKRSEESQFGAASIVQAGMEFDVTKWMFFDIFGDYRFNWFSFNSDVSHTQTGGFNVGAGIGFRF